MHSDSIKSQKRQPNETQVANTVPKIIESDESGVEEKFVQKGQELNVAGLCVIILSQVKSNDLTLKKILKSSFYLIYCEGTFTI
ncbi:hypothetical protein BpHYR1_039799 [Brachionus plicatilis]|uniref:Uncharacterized protein n=1 Tax=Brachionus plicatilis TaxID=10195 RepID=A0A3M7Q5Z6_BRAPC|nr:hypothetical protein BpHYR1_039799 [Brachionus plicatilis]